jgi:hypothetical protein
MEREQSIDRADISGAVARVAAQRRQRHRSAWPEGLAGCKVAERVTGMPDNAGAVRRMTPSGWLPSGVVPDGVLGEALRVWLRLRDGRAVAELARDPPAEGPRAVVCSAGHPTGAACSLQSVAGPAVIARTAYSSV